MTRFAVCALATCGLCCGSVAFGQERAPNAESSSTTATATADPADTKPTGTSSMAGVGQKPRKSDAAKPKMTAGGASALGTEDQQFVMRAASGGMKEVHMGQMAQQQGQSAEVKKLGGMIRADHTKANNELMALAAKKGVQVPKDHKMDKMSKKDMANFDQAWLSMMMMDHQQDIALYEKESKMGGDPELKKFAGKTLPVLKKHMAMVQAAQKKMSGATTAAKKG